MKWFTKKGKYEHKARPANTPEPDQQRMSQRMFQRTLKMLGIRKKAKARTPEQLVAYRVQRRKTRRLKATKKRGGGGARPRHETRVKYSKRFIKTEKKISSGV